MSTTLTQTELSTMTAPLEKALIPFTRRFPGSAGERQPVHTVYGGAHLFKHDTTRKLGEKALQVGLEHGVDAFTFSRAVGLPEMHAETVWTRVLEKLRREPVEDFRVDFEDGYGNRPDDEEDRDAVRVAGEFLKGMDEGTLPPFIGIRIKPLTRDLAARSLRTLDIFLSELLDKTGGTLPANFVITLPKILSKTDVETLVDVLELFEDRAGLEHGALRMEIMV